MSQIVRNDIGIQVGTFFYPWFGKNLTTNVYRHWLDGGHVPPTDWASYYLPNLYTGSGLQFIKDNLYNSFDIGTIRKQIELMKYSGIQFAISSWWGQKTYEDECLNKIMCVQHAMANQDPDTYAGFKWCAMHEMEGFSNPTVESLVSDLRYIKAKFTNSPYYFWKNGKPVIFVYAAAHAGSNALDDLARWEQARAQVPFYICFKRDPLTAGAAASRMDAWFEYAPADNYYSLLNHAGVNHSAFISPGFNLYDQAVRLAPASPSQFEDAVSDLKDASVQSFKTIQTWNEWGESTGIEPAQRINHNHGNFTLQSAPAQADRYHEILKRYFNP